MHGRCRLHASLTLKLEALDVYPQTEVLSVAIAAPRVSTKAEGAQSGKRHQRAHVKCRQVVAAHVEDLQRAVFNERVCVDLGQARVVCKAQHNKAGERAERAVLDARQRVERQVQVGELAQVAERRLRDLSQRVVAAVQVHQVGQVVELQRR